MLIWFSSESRPKGIYKIAVKKRSNPYIDINTCRYIDTYIHTYTYVYVKNNWNRAEKTSHLAIDSIAKTGHQNTCHKVWICSVAKHYLLIRPSQWGQCPPARRAHGILGIWRGVDLLVLSSHNSPLSVIVCCKTIAGFCCLTKLVADWIKYTEEIWTYMFP